MHHLAAATPRTGRHGRRAGLRRVGAGHRAKPTRLGQSASRAAHRPAERPTRLASAARLASLVRRRLAARPREHACRFGAGDRPGLARAASRLSLNASKHADVIIPFVGAKNSPSRDTTERHLRMALVTNSVRSLVSATTLVADPKPFVDAETRTVKAALLYADNLELRSYLIDLAIMANGLAMRGRMPRLALWHPIVMIAMATDGVLREYGIEMTSGLRRVARETRDAINAIDEPDAAMGALSAFYETAPAEFLALGRSFFRGATRFDTVLRSGLDSLTRAQEAGVLSLAGWSSKPPEFGESDEEYIERAAPEIAQLLSDQRRVIGVDAGVAHDWYGAGGIRQGDGHALAQLVLARLPTFASASIDEILDIREELRHPLRRFRREVSQLAAKLPEDACADDVDELWRAEITPTLDEIDELAAENRYLARLRDKVTEARTTLPAAGVLTVGMTGLTGVAQIVAASTGLAAVPMEAARAMREADRQLRRMRLYFVWRMIHGR